jgi:myo-inositol-1(or 4)-monophosphatase
VIGEEREGSAQSGKPYWLVDPICGTRPFASNIPLYCTNIALVEDGDVTVAAIGIGKSGEVLYAERGCGARSLAEGADRPITAEDSSQTIWIDGRTEQAASVVKSALLLKRWYVMQFPSSLAYAYLACGRIAGALQFQSNSPVPYGSVHAAAGCLVAREAGAIIRDLDDGTPWTLSTRSFVMAASTELCEDLSRLVSATVY